MCGCTMWDPALVSPPPVSESPRPTPTAEPPAEGPSPRISASCDELIPLEALRAIVTEDITFDPERSSSRSPEDAALEQLGALKCVWANRAPVPPWEDQDPDYASTMVQVVPDGEASWVRYSQIYSRLSGPSPYGDKAIGPNCHGAEPGIPGPPRHTCNLDALVGAYWLSLSMTAVGGGTAESNDQLVVLAREITDPLMATLASEEPPAPRWTPPAYQPVHCQTVLSKEQATSITGVEGLIVGQYLDGPKVGQFVHGLEGTAAKRCLLLIMGTDHAVAHISFLPGGGWAFRDRSDVWIATNGAVPLDLAGARPGEEFTEQCVRVEEDCRIDMLVGENWLQVTTYAYVPEKMSFPEGVDMLEARSQAREIAEAVLANLHAAE